MTSQSTQDLQPNHMDLISGMNAYIQSFQCGLQPTAVAYVQAALTDVIAFYSICHTYVIYRGTVVAIELSHNPTRMS